jgi:4-hydroxybenzoate polyprenyltransferase
LNLNVKKITRADEWWGYKLSPLLGIAYATTVVANVSLQQSINHILFLLLSLIIGAAYVSVINDVTDAKEDMAVGKANYMLKYPPYLR